MVTKKVDVCKVTKPGPFEGEGEITVRDILSGPDQMYGKGRVFCHTTIHPGSKIGYHIHENESETYYILDGRGTFNDNGVAVEFGPGDVLFTGDKQGHSMEASYGEKVEMVALILYHKI